MALLLLWLVLLFVGGGAYVARRRTRARHQGDDVAAATRQAVSDATPVVGAGVAGLLLFAGLGAFAILILFSSFDAPADSHRTILTWVWMLIGFGVAFLIGLPALAIAVVRHRKRRAG